MRTFITLAVIGVAIKLFLDTETGKDVVRRVKDMLAEAQEEFEDTLNTASDKVKSTANRMGNSFRETREQF